MEFTFGARLYFGFLNDCSCRILGRGLMGKIWSQLNQSWLEVAIERLAWWWRLAFSGFSCVGFFSLSICYVAYVCLFICQGEGRERRGEWIVREVWGDFDWDLARHEPSFWRIAVRLLEQGNHSIKIIFSLVLEVLNMKSLWMGDLICILFDLSEWCVTLSPSSFSRILFRLYCVSFV